MPAAHCGAEGRRLIVKRRHDFAIHLIPLLLVTMFFLLRPSSASAVAITNFSPTNGLVGAAVTINGSGFSTTPLNNTVKFNGVAATVSSSTAIKIVAAVPSGATTGTISVTVAGSTATSAATFTVKPQITSFSPTIGGVGDAVTLQGQGFSPTPASNTLTFHNVAAEISSANATQLVTHVPAGATTGTLKVTVGGNSFTTSANFTVRPSIWGFSPSMGCSATQVTVVGYNFSATPNSNTVKFNGVAGTVDTASSTQLQVTVPAGASIGAGPITVTVAGVTGTSNDTFTVTAPPTISGFSPTSGLPGTLITITGTGFNPDPAYDYVFFSGGWANPVSATDTEIVVAVPNGVLTGPIEVDVGGGAAISDSDFVTPLAITSLSTASAPVGSLLTIYGQNFDGTPSNNMVTFDNPQYRYIPAEIVGGGPNELTIKVPPGANGYVRVETNGDVAISSEIFKTSQGDLTFPPLGSARTEFVPSSGAIGNIVIIEGTGFNSVAANNTVVFNGVPATVLLASATELVTSVPASATTGPISVTVAGVTITTADSFTVRTDAHLLVPVPQRPLSEPDGQFGYSVAIDGDTAIVGAPGVTNHTTGVRSGAGFVLKRATPTNWQLQAVLEVGGGSANEAIGTSVSISQDTIVLGAPANSVSPGAAYVFERTGSTWTQRARLTASASSPGDAFGTSSALGGGTLLMGAPHSNAATSNAGATYVFLRVGTNWTQQAVLTASDATAGDLFGRDVAIIDSTALVGAPGAVGTAGAAYTFTRMSTTWTQSAKLTPDDAVAGQAFGASVAMDADDAIVGAPSVTQQPGAAYLFHRSGLLWVQSHKFSAETLAGFGSDVVLEDDTVAVGADFAVNVYRFSDTNGWQRTSGYVRDGQRQYGISLALSGDTFVTGTPLVETNEGGAAGTVAVYATADDFRPQAIFPAEPIFGGSYGISVAMSGNTALVGNFSDPTSVDFQTGSVYVFVRSGNGWMQEAKLTPADDAYQNGFGMSVALDGDTALIGAPGDSGSPGSAYVFHRIAGVWSQQGKLIPNDAYSSYINAGTSVAIKGDTAIVGAPGGYAVFGSTASGAAYVFTRAFNSWYFQSKLVASDANPNANFGSSVALEEDTAVIGAPGAQSNINHGAYVFARSAGVWNQEAKLRPSSPTFSDTFGIAVEISGGTVLIGASSSQDSSVSIPQGRVRVFEKSGSNWAQTGNFVQSQQDRFGASISATDDAFAITAPNRFPSAAVFPYFCSASPLHAGDPYVNSPDVDFDAYTNNAVAIFGRTIIEGGDLISNNVYAFDLASIPTSATISSVVPTPIAQGGTYVVSVDVSAMGGDCALHGTVHVSDGVGNTCTIAMPGSDNCSLPASQAGTHALSALFTPSNADLYQQSEGTAEVSIVTPDSAADISIVGVTPEPSVTGHAYVVQASVSPIAPATVAPTGVVMISDGTATCHVTLPASSCSLPSTTPGTVSLLASYSGDAHYVSTVSQPVSHTINGVSTLAVTGFTPTSGTVGTSVTISGRGFDVAPANNVVTFNGAAASITAASTTTLTVTVPNGASTGRVGVAVGSNLAMSNGTFTVVPVAERRVNVSINGVSPEPSSINQSFDVHVTVSASAQGVPIPTGTVAVTDGTHQCVVTLPMDVCSFAENAVGEVSLVATYSGDVSFDGAMSPAKMHITNPAVPTEICGFDPAANPADAPGFTPLDQLSGAVWSPGLVADITGNGALSVEIVTPAIGAVTSDAYVDVVGTFDGPVNTGITVNGVVGLTYEGQFLAAHVPLKPGSNALTVVATTLPGATASSTHSVVRSGNEGPISINVESPMGIAPSTVRFSYVVRALPGGADILSASLDYEDDGTFDYASSVVDDLPTYLAYSAPGLYTLVFKVIDTNNVVHLTKRKVIIQDQSVQRGMLCDVYSYLKARLTANDATGASNAFHEAVRGDYFTRFSGMGASMSNAVALLGTIVDGQIGSGFAELLLARDTANQTRKGFPLRLTQANDGVWRISEM